MGRTYDEFEIGQRFETPRRPVTEADINAFAGLTGDFNPVHMDALFAAQSGFGGRITHGPMIVGMAFGLGSRADLMDGTVLALLEIGWKYSTAPQWRQPRFNRAARFPASERARSAWATR